MRFVGGYDILLEGKPSVEIAKHAKVESLLLPLYSRRLDFSALRVEHGDSVKKGQILAGDPANYFIPLLAPMNGVVNLTALEGHITLENLSQPEHNLFEPDNEKTDPEDKRQKLVRLGVWAFISQLSSGRIPDPNGSPRALIIALTRPEPFFPVAEAYLSDDISDFIRGLNKLHEVLNNPEVHLIFPEDLQDSYKQLRSAIKEKAGWTNLVSTPDKYPHQHPAITARHLDLDPVTVWTIDPQAVCAVGPALVEGIPFLKRVVSIGGPPVKEPNHFKVPIGYPLSSLTNCAENRAEHRLIDGGVLTGRAIPENQVGLDAECTALTILQETGKREVLAFVQPGFEKHSYLKTFTSLFRPLFRENYTTAIRGEPRPCVFCGTCEDVCPVELLPHVIYRYVKNDRQEDALRAGLEKCIDCGLCSYVCLSKIEHLEMFLEEKRRVMEASAMEGYPEE